MREITLGLGDGETTIPVYEQSVPYLVRRVTRFGLTLGDAAELSEAGDIVAFFGDRTYDALCAVIPTLSKRMTREQFWPDDLLGDDVDEQALKQAPSVIQIRAAFKAAAEESGFDVLEALFKIVDPQMLRRAVNALIAERLSMSSLSSPQRNGGSPSTDSGTTAPASSETALSAHAG